MGAIIVWLPYGVIVRIQRKNIPKVLRIEPGCFIQHRLYEVGDKAEQMVQIQGWTDLNARLELRSEINGEPWMMLEKEHGLGF